MPSTARSTQFDTLTPIQLQVLKCLVAGRSISAAAREAGIHRTTVHLWTRTLPAFSRALLTLRQQRADQLLDELGDLAHLALDTFRQILSDPNAPASTRLKAAMEIVKLVEAQRPTVFVEPRIEKMHQDLSLAEVARSAPVGRNPSSASSAAGTPPPKSAPSEPHRQCGSLP